MRPRTYLAAAAVTTSAIVGALLVPGPASGTPEATPLGAQVAELRKQLEPYRDVDRAVADGYAPTDVCVPGMGYHYVSARRVMQPVDEDAPPILVYRPTKDGGRDLVAAEFFVPDADQDLTTDGDRPFLWARPFDGPMGPHEPGMPVHYDLHVWTHLPNPDGVLTASNPRVTC